MISFHTNHRLLAIVPVAVFVGLTLVIAVVPAIPLRPDGTRELTEDVRRGRELYNAEVWATRDAVALVEYLISRRPAGRAKRP